PCELDQLIRHHVAHVNGESLGDLFKFPGDVLACRHWLTRLLQEERNRAEDGIEYGLYRLPDAEFGINCEGLHRRLAPTGFRSPARRNVSMSIFFICRRASMAPSAVCQSTLPMSSGTTCQDKPNLSFSQPHCCAFGSPPSESFSQ